MTSRARLPLPFAAALAALPRALALALALAACGDNAKDDREPQGPPGLALVEVQVPNAYRTDVFAQPRRLWVPEGFAISVVARVPGARFMALAPDGDILLSRPGAYQSGDPARDGKIFRLHLSGDGTSQVTEFSSGLRQPHDLVFTEIGGTTYLYIAESHQVIRATYHPGAPALGPTQVILGGLPDNFSGELRGNYGHALKNLAIGGGRLYLSVASATNDDPRDVTDDPPRAAIYVAALDGSDRRLFAEGVRNAEGLDFAPDGTLWAAVNQRDNVAYPPGHPRAGERDGSYIDDHPAEPFTEIADGANYGWPYCNPNPDGGMTNLPLDADWDNNRNGQIDCGAMRRPNKGIQAHSAPLGFSFLHRSAFDAAYRDGAAVALHGCWNCTSLVGYKVVYFPWQNGAPGDERDLVTGWITSAEDHQQWGRPVDVIADAQGGLLISDDGSGTIYRLRRAQ